MSEKWTDEELAALTDEERAALLDDTQDDQEADQEEQDTTLDADDQQEESEDTDDESDDDSDQDETEGEQDDDDQAGDDEAEKTQEEARHHVPILDATEPEDAQERLEQITSQKDQLVQQFDDGELTAKEYQQQLDALAKQEREIEQQQFKAKLAAEMQEQQARNQWLATVNAFLDENPTYRESQLMYRTLDMVVRDLAQQEANAGLSGREILERAHQQIAEQFGLQQEDKPATKVTKKASRKTIDAPPTLKQMPAADNNEITDTKWDKLDRIAQTDPIKYEEELAKMSDAERDAYLAAG